MADLIERLYRLSATNVSDALDAFSLKSGTYGVVPAWEGAKKIAGKVVTVKLTAAGLTKSKTHLCVNAIEIAQKGDVIVIDNGGRIDTSCFGGILANGAQCKGIAGVVIDGACRDVDDYIEIGFPVYARGSVTATARGRIMEEATNVMIQFCGVQVRPGDYVLADRSGVVIVPAERIIEIIDKAEELFEKEESMIRDIRSGKGMLEVDTAYNYEKMLTK